MNGSEAPPFGVATSSTGSQVGEEVYLAEQTYAELQCNHRGRVHSVSEEAKVWVMFNGFDPNLHETLQDRLSRTSCPKSPRGFEANDEVYYVGPAREDLRHNHHGHVHSLENEVGRVWVQFDGLTNLNEMIPDRLSRAPCPDASPGPEPPHAFKAGDEVYYVGRARDDLRYNHHGHVHSLANEVGRVWVKFDGLTKLEEIIPDRLFRTPGPEPPHGFEVGDQVYFVGHAREGLRYNHQGRVQALWNDGRVRVLFDGLTTPHDVVPARSATDRRLSPTPGPEPPRGFQAGNQVYFVGQPLRYNHLGRVNSAIFKEGRFQVRVFFDGVPNHQDVDLDRLSQAPGPVALPGFEVGKEVFYDGAYLQLPSGLHLSTNHKGRVCGAGTMSGTIAVQFEGHPVPTDCAPDKLRREALRASLPEVPGNRSPAKSHTTFMPPLTQAGHEAKMVAFPAAPAHEGPFISVKNALSQTKIQFDAPPVIAEHQPSSPIRASQPSDEIQGNHPPWPGCLYPHLFSEPGRSLCASSCIDTGQHSPQGAREGGLCSEGPQQLQGGLWKMVPWNSARGLCRWKHDHSLLPRRERETCEEGLRADLPGLELAISRGCSLPAA